MAEEIKKPDTQQASAQGDGKKPEDQQGAGDKGQPQAQPTLAQANPESLQELYTKSPDLFEKAGFVKKPEPKKEPPKPPPDQQSAAPTVTYEGKEITLPKDLPVNAKSVEKYLQHAKEIGHSPDVVQKEIDFQSQQAREAIAAQRDLKAQDAANIKVLKKEFGEDYEQSMEIARQAATKHADSEMLERLKASDPVTIRLLLKLGKADAEVPTPKGGAPRTGDEDPLKTAKEKQEKQLKGRYNKSPELFGQGPK